MLGSWQATDELQDSVGQEKIIYIYFHTYSNGFFTRNNQMCIK